MGGVAAGYARPVTPTSGRMSSWRAHTNRNPPSTEPGTDYYCAIGTPIRAAAAGVVVDVGDSIQPATGRYVTIDLADGRRVRYLHLLNRLVGVGNRVQWGQIIAHSGATGYGEADWSWNVAETGGAHVHMTLWAHQRYTFGRYTTLDPEQYMAPNQGLNVVIEESEEDEMTISYINITGKAGARRGGCYAVMRDNSGNLFARFTSFTPLATVPTVSDERAVTELQASVPGLG